MAGVLPSWGGNYFRNVLGVVAGLELLVAGGMAVAAVINPDLRGGLLPTAGILGVVGLGLLAWARRAGRAAQESRRIVATGLPGTATITELTQTGLRVNDNPQVEMDLRVEIEGRDPYMVTQREIVPQTLVGTLTSGGPLPVRVDPNDLSKVVVLWGSGGAEAASGLTPEELEKMRAKVRAKVRENPIGATALVRKIKESGVQVGDYHIMEFEIEFRFDDGRPPFRDEGNAAVPSAVAPHVKPGLEIPAQVSRDAPSIYVVDWTQVPTA